VISVLQYRNRQSWSYMYGSWIYNYLCNQCLSPLTLWVRIPLRRGVPVQNTLCDKVCQWLAAGMWFSPGTLVSSTNKTGRHDITEILLKVALIKHNNPTSVYLLTWFNFVLLMHINSIKSTSSGHFQSKWSFFYSLLTSVYNWLSYQIADYKKGEEISRRTWGQLNNW
jgi:hypothetical protein